jgi:hypothetical protein
MGNKWSFGSISVYVLSYDIAINVCSYIYAILFHISVKQIVSEAKRN